MTNACELSRGILIVLIHYYSHVEKTILINYEANFSRMRNLIRLYLIIDLLKIKDVSWYNENVSMYDINKNILNDRHL